MIPLLLGSPLHMIQPTHSSETLSEIPKFQVMRRYVSYLTGVLMHSKQIDRVRVKSGGLQCLQLHVDYLRPCSNAVFSNHPSRL